MRLPCPPRPIGVIAKSHLARHPYALLASYKILLMTALSNLSPPASLPPLDCRFRQKITPF
jgi:hypothetical protein